MTDNLKRPRHPQPMQPIVVATDKVLRFQPNAIVAFIVDAIVGAHHHGHIVTKTGERIDFNALMAMPWADADRDQFNQLNGYSVSGLPWRQNKARDEAERLGAKVWAKHVRGRYRKAQR